MKAIHIFAGVNGGDDPALRNPARKRQLHQNAIHRVVVVELLHQRHNLGFGDRRVEVVVARQDPNLCAGPHLATDVDLAGGIGANPHHSERQRDALLCQQRRLLPDGRLDALGHQLPVENAVGDGP